MTARHQAAAIVFALASLLPVRGQTTTGCPVIGTYPNGTAVQYTLGTLVQPLMFGIDPIDNTKTWTTTVRFLNRTLAFHTSLYSLTDTNGKPGISTMVQMPTGIPALMFNGELGLFGLGETEDTYTGATPTANAIPAFLKVSALQNPVDSLPNIVASALVQETDTNGKILQSYEVIDPCTAVMTTATGFMVGADLFVANVDVALLLSSVSGGTVTISVYGLSAASSTYGVVASAQVYLAPGALTTQTLGQIFSGNADLAKYGSQVPLPGWNWTPNMDMVTITADQPFALAVSRTNTRPTDGSLVQTQSFAFPVAQE